MYGLQCILRVSLYCLRTPLREKGLFTTCKAAVRERRRPCLNWQCDDTHFLQSFVLSFCRFTCGFSGPTWLCA